MLDFLENYGSEVHNARVGGSDISIIHFNYTYTDNEVNSTKGNPTFKIIYHFFREVVGRFIYKDGWDCIL